MSFVGTFLLNKFLGDFYKNRKIILENRIEKFLNKEVDLGDYSGIRFLGISLKNLKIADNANLNSEIVAKNVYVGIMPIRSFLKQRWIFNVTPKKAKIEINKDFFKRGEFDNNEYSRFFKNKVKYDLNLNLKEYSNFKLNDSGILTKVRGKLIYKSQSNEFLGNLNLYAKGKGNLNFKFNSNLNKDLLNLKIYSSGIDLKDSEYIFSNRKFAIRRGKIKSNFKFYKTSKQTFCTGNISLNNLELKTTNLAEDISTDYLSFLCQGNNLIAKTKNLNYGSLNSDLNLNIPLNESINNINLKGSIGYLNSQKPEIQLSGNIPYWLDRRGINFGNINSSFVLDRTLLSNLNIFKSKEIDGFVNASGELTGKINDPDISIIFDVNYPFYRGIRIREKWKGTIKNEKNKFLLDLTNGSSPIPSFLSMKFDSNIKFENLNFSRKFNSKNKGVLEIEKDYDGYIWKANNFPLGELEFEISDNQFERIGGIINGEGYLSSEQSDLIGRVDWKSGKLANIKFDNSSFDFSFKDKKLNIKSKLYPLDGGIIEFLYDSKNKNRLNANFNNISTSWAILTAIDIFNFENLKEVLPKNEFNVIEELRDDLITAVDLITLKKEKEKVIYGTSKDLNDLQISKDDKSFKERIKFINDFSEKNDVLEDKFKLKNYLNKLNSRYDAILNIETDNESNYKIKTKLKGYLDVSNNEAKNNKIKNKKTKNNKDQFALDLEGGLLNGKGSLIVNQLPLKVLNILFDKPKDFNGGLDIKLNYDLDNKNFVGSVNSENLSLKNNEILINEALFFYDDSKLDIILSLFLNDSKIPINLNGSIPSNKNDELNLKLKGDKSFIELIDILADDYFTFKDGDINFWMKLSGSINDPIANGFINIKDSEIQILNKIFNNLRGKIIFDFKRVEIEEEIKASINNSEEQKINIIGALPFKNQFNIEDVFRGRFQFSFIPDQIQILDSLKNIFSNKKTDITPNFKLNSTFSELFALDKNNLISDVFQMNPEVFKPINIVLETEKLNIKTDNLDFNIDSNIYINGSLINPILGGNLHLNGGFINFNSSNKKNNIDNNEKNAKKNWPELYWNNQEKIELFTNETKLNSFLLGKNLPNYFRNIGFNDLQLKLGPSFKLQYGEIFKVYLDNKSVTYINGKIGKDLQAWGGFNLSKGRANLYTTPFKLDKNKDNFIFFTENNGIVPYVGLHLFSKVPDSIIPIRENNQDTNISGNTKEGDSSGFGSFGIGNTRLIRIEASYEGFLDQLSFDDENKRIQLRSTPSYNRSQIIGLIGGNSANLINRTFMNQFNSAEAFSERFQLALYPALIENDDSLNKVFSKENLDNENDLDTNSNEGLSSQAWVAEIGFDIAKNINFAVQAIPGRDDLPPLGIVTYQANEYLELLGSFDSEGEWKSQLQLYWRY